MVTPRGSEHGGALILVVVVSILIVGIAAAFMALTAATTEQTSRDALGLQALYCAETGVAVAVASVNAGTLPLNGTGDCADGLLNPVNYGGSPPQDAALVPILTGQLGTGRYEVTIALWGFDRNYAAGDPSTGVDNDGDGEINEADEDNYMTITARGIIDGSEGKQVVRQVEVILARVGGGVWWNAIHESGDAGPNAALGDMVFKGTGKDADYIDGDIYINGRNVSVNQQADINGSMMVNGGTWTDNSSVWGGNGTSGVQPSLDLAKYNYPVNNDVNVLASLKDTSKAKYGPGVPQGGGSPVGGKAWQLPATDPSHIFRRNPSDRTGVYSSYNEVIALEDPYEKLQNDANWNGTDATKISYTKGFEYGKTYFVGPQKPGDKVAMIIDNTSTYSYKFLTPGAESSGQQNLIAVQGDIYISDNIFHTNKNKDAVVFIALKNPDGTGGNIYFGDTRFGTVEDFNAYMFAENNFVSTNVSYSNSKILVNGNMAAGNRVIMNLDSPGSPPKHHKWNVVFDDRLKKTIEGTANGASSLDGIASLVDSGVAATGTNYSIVSWKQEPPKARPSFQGYSFSP